MSRSFTTQRQFFGDSLVDQNECRRQELYVCYGLVQPENIEEITNMSLVFQTWKSHGRFENVDSDSDHVLNVSNNDFI